jgi:hypothetical protein
MIGPPCFDGAATKHANSLESFEPHFKIVVDHCAVVSLS